MKKSFKFGWWSLLLLAVLLFTAVWGQGAPSSNTQGPKIKEPICLSPDAFPQLPGWIKDFLNNQGYKIPQSQEGFRLKKPKNNVISGQFYVAGQRDWAVKVYKDGWVQTLVFRNGLYHSMDKYKNYYGRVSVLLVAKREKVEGYYTEDIKFLNYPKYFSEITHEGIEDRYAPNASTIYYRDNGKWYEIPGAD